MGGRQSRRSVDITTTPKKEGLPADGSVGDAAAPGDGKLERIEETDTKPTTNGIAPHTDVVEDKEKDKDEATEKEKDKEKVRELDTSGVFDLLLYLLVRCETYADASLDRGYVIIGPWNFNYTFFNGSMLSEISYVYSLQESL